MHTKITLKVKLFFLIALIYTILILTLSLINLSDVKVIKLESSDKVYHAVSYGLMILLWLFFYKIKFKTVSSKQSFTLILVIIVFGIIIEYLQLFLTSYRSFDWWDVAANTGGVIIGFLLFKTTLKLFNNKNI